MSTISVDKNILVKISEQAPEITEYDIDQWIVPELCEHYSIKIKALATYAYGSTIHQNGNGLSVALQAFRERARAEIRSAANTFIIINQHWRSGRDINTYLLTCLGRLASGIHNDVDGQRRISVPICPACRIYGEREYLCYDGKLLRCETCYTKISNLQPGPELSFRKIFAIHSRVGYRCPDCERFIPKSFGGNSCPYNDCSWFGDVDLLESMTHPLGLGRENNLSLDVILPNTVRETSLHECIDAKQISADSNIEIEQQFKLELNTLNDVIDAQIESVKRTSSSGERSYQKLLMYQAYKNLVKSSPEEMVSYLVHLKHFGISAPIQSRIFQEYVRLVENALPFSISRGNNTAEICSLLDPNLNLFLGVSEFEATVTNGGIIPNNTTETYIGGREFKFFGPCFIGMVIEIKDRNTNELLTNKVKSYSFMQIIIDDSVPVGTPVNVQHFRIASHYELGPMVNLQRTRRKIVDSVYFRLHKQKRKINEA